MLLTSRPCCPASWWSLCSGRAPCASLWLRVRTACWCGGVAPNSLHLYMAEAVARFMPPHCACWPSFQGNRLCLRCGPVEDITLPAEVYAPWPALPLLIDAGKNQMHELGPGMQIKAMVKRIDNTAWAAFQNLAA